ncbi:nucleotidyltransferase domain-containing protein [Thermococcus indicus]|uniref:Nucleotidyltransferase domain-containing protein n=1 Tax=Thermococcus indicus TaxID=2586643 RepID=A0A4Y5SK65_9EURY|nr:nucleotidyltransferase domain-containing protein [Thermococcus indicus]QDA31283.1 nucleotidyltransferase domain-containing protein [Thermococcus indicus]
MELAGVGKKIRDAFGDRVEEVIIFGSRARGDFKEDSDLDILVILKDEVKPEDWEIIAELSANMTLELGVSVMIVPHIKRDSLYRTAKSEGIAV